MWKKISIRKLLLAFVTIIFVAGAVFWLVDRSPQYPPILITKSKNGHDFWFMPMHGTDQTAISVIWETDLEGLPPGMERGAIIGAGMMQTGGAGELNAKELSSQLNELDAGFHLKVLPQRIEAMFISSGPGAIQAAEIAGLKLVKPKLEASIFDALKNQEISQGQKAKKFNNQIAWQTARAMMFEGHPYQQFWSQIDNNRLSEFSLDDVKEWHRLSFSREPAHIVTVSGASIEEAGAIVDKLLANTNSAGIRKNPKKRFARLNIPSKTILVHVPKSKMTNLLIIGFVPPTGGPRHLEMVVANSILARGSNSRLSKQLPENSEEFFHFAGGYEEYTNEHRIFWMGGEIGKGKLTDQLEKIENIYNEFVAQGVSWPEFIFAKRFMRKFVDAEFKNPLKIATIVMTAKSLGGGPKYLPKINDTIANMSRSRTNEIIREDFPKFGEMMRIVVSPDRNIVEADCIIASHHEIENCI